MSDERGKGKRFNEGKPRISLIPASAMRAEAKVWEMGERKYGKKNWSKGMKWTIPIDCMFRHLLAISEGEDIDPESGELHAAHIRTNAAMLIEFFTTYPEGDDRKEYK
jgi:hypothetical protein